VKAGPVVKQDARAENGPNALYHPDIGKRAGRKKKEVRCPPGTECFFNGGVEVIDVPGL
jgi:hypothetical protein